MQIKIFCISDFTCNVYKLVTSVLQYVNNLITYSLIVRKHNQWGSYNSIAFKHCIVFFYQDDIIAILLMSICFRERKIFGRC